MKWNQFKSKYPTIVPSQVKQQSTKHKLRQELEMQVNREEEDYNARTESCCTKESTPTKDTSPTVARPQSRFMQWNQFKSKCPTIIPNQVKQQSTKHKVRQKLEMQVNREEEGEAGS